MTGAGETLLGAAAAALGTIGGLGRVYDGPPLQAAMPYALVAIDSETDWSHKTAAGREVRLTASLYDKGERPERLRRLVTEAEAALAGIGGTAGAWQVASLVFLRARILRGRDGVWTGIVEFRARLLDAG